MLNANVTYEELARQARETSKRLTRYAAVVEVVTYMTGSSYHTVMVGVTRIKTESRRSQFVGVMCQFWNGEPVA